MWPLRPTAIATPGATASSIAVFTTLSSLPTSEVSSPELLRPTSGATYLIGGGGAATDLVGGGGAHAASMTSDAAARDSGEGESKQEAKDFIDSASGSGTDECRRQMERPAATILAVARRSLAHPVVPGQLRVD